MHKALFLDRDGVINHNHGYVYKIKDFDFIDGIFDLVKRAVSLNYKIVVVTNQSGIARNYYTENDFKILSDWMIKRFEEEGTHIDGLYYCPHHPQYGDTHYRKTCECRKPNPGMIIQAAKELNLELSNSVLVGDKISDVQCAINANLAHVFYLHEHANSPLDGMSDIDKGFKDTQIKQINAFSDIRLA